MLKQVFDKGEVAAARDLFKRGDDADAVLAQLNKTRDDRHKLTRKQIVCLRARLGLGPLQQVWKGATAKPAKLTAPARNGKRKDPVVATMVLDGANVDATFRLNDSQLRSVMRAVAG